MVDLLLPCEDGCKLVNFKGFSWKKVKSASITDSSIRYKVCTPTACYWGSGNPKDLVLAVGPRVEHTKPTDPWRPSQCGGKMQQHLGGFLFWSVALRGLFFLEP